MWCLRLDSRQFSLASADDRVAGTDHSRPGRPGPASRRPSDPPAALLGCGAELARHRDRTHAQLAHVAEGHRRAGSASLAQKIARPIKPAVIIIMKMMAIEVAAKSQMSLSVIMGPLPSGGAGMRNCSLLSTPRHSKERRACSPVPRPRRYIRGREQGAARAARGMWGGRCSNAIRMSIRVYDRILDKRWTRTSMMVTGANFRASGGVKGSKI